MRKKRITRTSIEVTDACTLFCNACKTPHGNNFISISEFTTLAQKLRGHISGLGLHWRGEPCLHPQLPELAKRAKGLGLKPWLSTNTAVPNLSKPDYVKNLLDNLDWIEICVDGYNEETAGKYRVGANWAQIKRNLLTISKTKTRCIKKMRVLMFKYNDGKEDVYRKMAKTYGMNQIIFARPLIGLGETISANMAQEWLSTNRRYRRYTQRGEKWARITGPCYANPMISVHGTVHPCCLDWGLQHPLGDLTTESWRGVMKRYWKMVPKLGGQPICELCCSPAQQVNFREKII